MINVGAQLFTFRNVLKSVSDLRDVFKLLQEEGGGSAQLSGLKFQYDAAECRALAMDYGIVLPLTHTPWDRILHDTDRVIDDHLALGAVMVGLGMMPAAYRSEDGLKRFSDEVNAVSEKLNSAGLLFGYHNHAAEFTKVLSSGKRTFDFLKEKGRMPRDPLYFRYLLVLFRRIRPGRGNQIPVGQGTLYTFKRR